MPATLEAESLSRTVDDHPLLQGVGFRLELGEILAVVGPSGAGKTTLLRLLNRLDEPDQGTTKLDGEPTAHLAPTELRRRVGYVAQEPVLLGDTVTEDVGLGPRLHGRRPAADKVQQVLEACGIEHLADRSTADLSGGERQRVAIARAVLNDPEVLLLDEPTAELDPASTDRIEALIRRLADDLGLAVVLVSHDPGQARRLADRVLVLEAGKVVDQGSPDEVIA